MRDILSSIPKIFEGFEGSGPAAEAAVFGAWKSVVGDALDQHAVPVRLIKKRLIVAVASETWRRQVTDLSGQMVFKLNAALGSPLVSFVDFRVDAKAVRQHQEKAVADGASNAEWNALANNEITPQLESAAERITDESLRSVFLAAAGSSLARRRKQER